MRANSQFAIAIHILSLLALSEKTLSSSQIAGSAGANPAFIRRIIGHLQRAGLVETQMGTRGGVSPTKSPQSVTLLDVYDATEQAPLLSLHHSKPLETCLCGGNIEAVLSPIFGDAEAVLKQKLAQYTIQDVVDSIHQAATPPLQLILDG